MRSAFGDADQPFPNQRLRQLQQPGHSGQLVGQFGGQLRAAGGLRGQLVQIVGQCSAQVRDGRADRTGLRHFIDRFQDELAGGHVVQHDQRQLGPGQRTAVAQLVKLIQQVGQHSGHLTRRLGPGAQIDRRRLQPSVGVVEADALRGGLALLENLQQPRGVVGQVDGRILQPVVAIQPVNQHLLQPAGRRQQRGRLTLGQRTSPDPNPAIQPGLHLGQQHRTSELFQARVAGRGQSRLQLFEPERSGIGGAPAALAALLLEDTDPGVEVVGQPPPVLGQRTAAHREEPLTQRHDGGEDVVGASVRTEIAEVEESRTALP